MVFATLSVLFQHINYIDIGRFAAKFLRLTRLSDYYAMYEPYSAWVFIGIIFILMWLFSCLTHTLIIDCIHRSRGQMTYKLVACKALVKKTWVFSMVIILLTTAMVMGSALLFLMPYIKLGSYLAIPSYLKVIFSMTFVAIPFVILTVYLVFASSIAIIDDRGIWSSIRAGFALVSKRWWFTAIRLLVVCYHYWFMFTWNLSYNNFYTGSLVLFLGHGNRAECCDRDKLLDAIMDADTAIHDLYTRTPAHKRLVHMDIHSFL